MPPKVETSPAVEPTKNRCVFLMWRAPPSWKFPAAQQSTVMRATGTVCTTRPFDRPVGCAGSEYEDFEDVEFVRVEPYESAFVFYRFASL